MSPGIVAESDLNGNLTSEYVFFDGERVARKDFAGGTTSVAYYFSDHLKTASVITDSAGVIKSESDFYPWGGELQFVANDSNHYKFTGKERDTETNLDYFGARYYSNGLARFITPGWAAKATAVPYADFADPQSLNLYTYVRNIPTTRVDAEGHCADDKCAGIIVTIKVTSEPAHKTNEEVEGVYKTGVSGQATITLTKDGKPLAGVSVKETVTATTTKNGNVVSKDPGANPNAVKTDAKGQVPDKISLQLTTKKPVTQAVSNAVQTDQATNTFTMQATQTLTFPGPNGATCSCTDQRTLTNADKTGNPSTTTNSSGSNYTLTVTPANPQVKEIK
jgi:RHS repeat-associated protein